MAQFRRTRSPLNSTAIVRIIAVGIGLVFLVLALRFAMEMPDVMPGNAAGILVLVFVGTVLILGAIWIGI
ncbi:hypothetical protein GOB93_08320 [Acetobacter musti]|uniref:Uncharacterized protein n=1 Tax=Acetobacter musti TaxID=864732 RepID=A0ABX0JRJ5_9PROT|nr:hypothetical protein [Acetobacter musti]NHN84648.1 hypothetical protein [Acetobacter musti]